jgi:mobilome CxxCx(11)CxxC protein
MLDSQITDTISQRKLDSLAAKHLHVKQLVKLSNRNRLVDFLAIAVPVVYFVFRFLAKGTRSGYYIELIWEILAALLLALTILKIVYKWQERAERHNKLLGENIALVGQADNLLSDRQTASPESARLFLVLAANSETADRELLGRPSEEDRKFAYREALKEFQSGRDTVCPQCKASPWNFVPGSCQLCGNTPNDRQLSEVSK